MTSGNDGRTGAEAYGSPRVDAFARDPAATGEDPRAGEVMPIGGYRVHSVASEALAHQLLAACSRREKIQVFFANTNFVVKCRQLRPRLQSSSVRVVNDGIGMDLAALLIHRRRFAVNLNGTDFVPDLCRRSPRPLRFFLLGSAPGVAERAARHLVDVLGQQVTGICDGYAQYAEAGDGLVQRINDSGADVVLVAFGNPRQEAWILDHRAAVSVPVMLGVGALLDFLSGNAKRAPDWVRSCRLEWFYRLSREPKRLLRRYTLDLLLFFWVCLRAGKRTEI